MFSEIHDKCRKLNPNREINPRGHYPCPPDQQEADTQFVLGLAVGVAITAVYVLCTSLTDVVTGIIQQPTLF